MGFFSACHFSGFGSGQKFRTLPDPDPQHWLETGRRGSISDTDRFFVIRILGGKDLTQIHETTDNYGGIQVLYFCEEEKFVTA
jgi:hypothetical protein